MDSQACRKGYHEHNAKGLSGLAKEALSKYKGKSILIIVHSNTVLETIEEFGGVRPLPALTDEDYDYIFKLRKLPGGKLKTEVYHYDAEHHNSGADVKMMQMK